MCQGSRPSAPFDLLVLPPAPCRKRPFRGLDAAPTPRGGRGARRAISVASVIVPLLAAGCDRIFPYQSAAIRNYQCAAKVEVAKLSARSCDQYITVTGGRYSLTPQLAVFANSDPAPGQYPRLYLDEDYVPTADGIPEIVKGTCLVRLPAKDSTSEAPDYLALSFQAPPDNVFIAFDRRAKTLPPWLQASFLPVAGAILKSTERPKSGPGSPNVQYQIFEPKTPSAFASGASLGGNSLGTGWAAEAGAQYLVFVRKTQPSAANPGSYPITIEVCATEAGASSDNGYQNARNQEPAIVGKWAQDQKLPAGGADPTLSFQPQDCRAVYDNSAASDNVYKICGTADVVSDNVQSKTSGLVINAWPRTSTAFIDPARSSATIQALGASRTVPVGGPISFRIDEKSNLTIDEITLFAAPFSVKDATIGKISVGQRGSVLAVCADTPTPKPYGLCGSYSVPATDNAFAALGATVNGDPVFTPLINRQPIPVTVDFNNRIFKLGGGGIAGRIPTRDGSGIDVQLSLDVTGAFVNFAPVASTLEMKKKFECKDGNRGLVVLDARASYDLDQGKATLLYKWVEDAGTPAERVLGDKDHFSAPMNFGGHRITLSVEDDRSVVTSVTFDVEVVDPGIDRFEPPADVYAVVKGPGAPVSIGQATASDDCSGHVKIRNNAPGMMLFPAGFTPVDWIFDDYRGNVAIRRQNVFVLPPAWFPPPVATGHAAFQAASATDPSRSLVYTYGIKGQGKAMETDEYILLETPGGGVYSLDERNRFRRRGEIAPHGPTFTFGASDTSAVLVVDRWDQRFPENGTYVFRHILVRPKGDPRNGAQVIAHHQLEVRNGPPPSE